MSVATGCLTGQDEAMKNEMIRSAHLRFDDGVELEVNVFVLSSYSPYFRALFYGGFGQSTDGCYRFEKTIKERKWKLQTLETACFVSFSKLESLLVNIICELITKDFLVEVVENETYLSLTTQQMELLLQEPTLRIKPEQERAAFLTWAKVQGEEERVKMEEKLKEFSHAQKLMGSCRGLMRRYPNSILCNIGGWSSQGVSDATECYSERCTKWVSSKAAFRPVPIAYQSLLLRPEGIFMVGGFNGRVYHDTLQVFLFNKQTWENLEPMAERRSYSSAAFLGEAQSTRFIVLGGFNGIERLDSVEMYDIAAEEWKFLPHMNYARSDGAAVSLRGRVWAIGGYDGSKMHPHIEFFDPFKQSWEMCSKAMHTARTGVNAIALGDDVIAVLGGFNGNKRLRSVELYDIREGIWHRVNDMITPRSNFCVETYDATVVVAGGYNGSRTTAAVESWDPRTNKWQSFPNLVVDRSALRMTRVDDCEAIQSLIDPI